MPLGDKTNFINSIVLLCGHRHNKRLHKTAYVSRNTCNTYCI